jgi:hypothetical protein
LVTKTAKTDAIYADNLHGPTPFPLYCAIILKTHNN